MSEKPKRRIDEVEELPDAWERFEKAFDKVMKAKPMPVKKAPRGPSPAPSEKRGEKRPA
jgi:hypothetical protein